MSSRAACRIVGIALVACGRVEGPDLAAPDAGGDAGADVGGDAGSDAPPPVAPWTLRKVGAPKWRPVGLHRFAARLGACGSVETYDALWAGRHKIYPDAGVGPGAAHEGPYEHELDVQLAGAGLRDDDTFDPSEFTNGAGVHVVFTIVPDDGAPLGATVDGARGPIVPNLVLPIVATSASGAGATLTRNGEASASSPLPYPRVPVDVGLLGDDGFSHIPVFLAADANAAHAPVVDVQGSYAWEMKLRDATSAGYDVSIPFEVRAKPPPGPGCTDIQRDPHNCGACGHDCGGGTCFQGACAPRDLFPGKAVISDGKDVYAATEGGTYRVEGGQPGTRLAPATGNFLAVNASALLVGGSSVFFVQKDGSAWYPLALPTIESFSSLALNSTDAYAMVNTPAWELGFQPISAFTSAETLPVPGSAEPFVVADEAGAYWSDGTLWKLPVGATTPVAIGALPATPLAIDDAAIYASVAAGGAVDLLSAPKTGGAFATVAAIAVPAAPVALAVDATNAYVALRGAASQLDVSGAAVSCGMLFAVPLRGGAPRRLAIDQTDVRSLTSDGANVYYVADFAVVRTVRN